MSDGLSDAKAVGEIGRELELAAMDLRKAIRRAEQGYRGLSVDIATTVNKEILPHGWKLIRAERIETFR